MSIRLEIEPAYRAALAAAGLTTFDAFMNAKAEPAVSKHRHRETVPLEIDVDGSPKRFFLKRVFRVPPAHAIWPVFRLRSGYSQPAREWAACKSMREAGLPAMERVAFGERRKLGVPAQAFILVAASPYLHTLEEWLTPGFKRPRALSNLERLELIKAVAELGHRIDDAGFVWPDADAKHICTDQVRVDGAPAWRFTLIDLERVFPRKELPCNHFPMNFLRIVRSMNPFRLGPEEVEAIGTVPEFDLDIFNVIAKGQMYFGRGTVFEDGLRFIDGYIHPRQNHMQRVGGVHLNPRYQDSLTAAGFGSMDAVFALDGGRSLTKPGLSAHRDRIQIQLDQVEGMRRAAYLKRYRTPPIMEQIRRIWSSGFKRSTARLEARFARRLDEAGIGTLTTIAWGQEMQGPFERRSFLITDEVPGESLEKLAAKLVRGEVSLAATDKFDVICQLAMLTRRMHGEGLFHRDFYLCHIFLSRNQAGLPVMRVIDLGRMITQTVQGGWRWMVKDLASLDYSSPKSVVTRADRVRFLYHYLTGVSDRPRPGSRQKLELFKIVQAVARRNRKTAAHDARRAARYQRSQNKA